MIVYNFVVCVKCASKLLWVILLNRFNELEKIAKLTNRIIGKLIIYYFNFAVINILKLSFIFVVYNINFVS